MEYLHSVIFHHTVLVANFSQARLEWFALIIFAGRHLLAQDRYFIDINEESCKFQRFVQDIKITDPTTDLMAISAQAFID